MSYDSRKTIKIENSFMDAVRYAAFKDIYDEEEIPITVEEPEIKNYINVLDFLIKLFKIINYKEEELFFYEQDKLIHKIILNNFCFTMTEINLIKQIQCVEDVAIKKIWKHRDILSMEIKFIRPLPLPFPVSEHIRKIKRLSW